MFPYILFVGLAALLMAILNAMGHFATPALSPTMLNIAMIGCALYLAPHLDPPILSLAIGVLLGGAGQLLIQMPVAWQRGMSAHRGLHLSDPSIRRIARLMAPGVAGLAVTQLNVFIGTLLASFLGEGSISILYYAFRLIQFPIGIFGVAIATAAFPTMARQAANHSLEEVGSTAASLSPRPLRHPAIHGRPLVFRVPIVQLLFERGAFDRTVTLATADAVFFYALGLGAYVSTRVLVPAFYSIQDTGTPVKIGAVAVLVNVLSSLLLMRPLGAGGLALATALSSFVNLGLLLTTLRRRLGTLGEESLWPPLLRMGVAAAAMGLFGLVLLHSYDPLTAEPVLYRAMVVTLQLAASLAVFLVAAALLGSEELKSLLRRAAHLGRRLMTLPSGDDLSE
jgi:putative peptidoglycan lipid II flippase